MGDYDKAESYYKSALNIEFDEYAILGLALISKLRGNYDTAIESLKGLLKNDVKNHRLYTEIADCWLRLGDKSKAIETLNDFQQLGIRNSYVNEMLADITR
jgi:tetratricopeptide (TPR) repeat protein